MKLILIASLFASCAHKQASSKKDLVSVETALNQAQASYLKGCVDILKDLLIPNAFTGCRDKSLVHRRELDEIMNTDL